MLKMNIEDADPRGRHIEDRFFPLKGGRPRQSGGCFRSTRELEYAVGAGQVEVSDLRGCSGLSKAMAQQRSHSLEFKRQVSPGVHCWGNPLWTRHAARSLASADLRLVEKYEAGGLDSDARAADLLHGYETKIAALERIVGRRRMANGSDWCY
jgi:hypothetical protein